MNERSLSAELRRRIFVLGRVKKLSDRFTSGIADFVIHFGGVSSWWEVKYMRRPNISELTHQPGWETQLAELILDAQHAHVVYLIFTKFKGDRDLLCTLIHPAVLRALLTRGDGDAFDWMRTCCVSAHAPAAALVRHYVEHGFLVVRKPCLPAVVSLVLHARCLRLLDVQKCIESIHRFGRAR